MNEYVLINKSTDLTDAKELDLLLEASLVTMGEYASAHATTPICATWAATDDEFKAKVAAGARPVVFQRERSVHEHDRRPRPRHRLPDRQS